MVGFQTNEIELTSYGLKSFVPKTGLTNMYLKYEKKITISICTSYAKICIWYFNSQGLSRFNVRQSTLQARHAVYVRTWHSLPELFC